MAIARQKTKDWKPSHDREKLKCALRQKLVDIRPTLKKRFESVDYYYSRVPSPRFFSLLVECPLKELL